MGLVKPAFQQCLQVSNKSPLDVKEFKNILRTFLKNYPRNGIPTLLSHALYRFMLRM